MGKVSGCRMTHNLTNSNHQLPQCWRSLEIASGCIRQESENGSLHQNSNLKQELPSCSFTTKWRSELGILKELHWFPIHGLKQ